MSRLHELYKINPCADGGSTILAREGPGDYRLGAAIDTRGLFGRAHDGARHHNPVRVAKPMDHRESKSAHRYVAKRNGLPEGASWEVTRDWRRPGWQARAARNGLDLAAIALADAELAVTRSL
jgi:hypothetical protein